MDDLSKKSSAGQPSTENSNNCLITKFRVRSSQVVQETGWLVRMMNLGIDSPGFLSAEIIPPDLANNNHWRLVQRFRQADQITAWRESESRRKLMAEIAAQLPGADTENLFEEDVCHEECGSVATAVMTKVNVGMESAYRDWESKVQVAQAKFPGYRGTYIQPPTGESQLDWTTLLRFDSPDTLEKWFKCDERKILLDEAAKIVSATDFKQLSNSFPGWFPTDPKTGEGPPVWKTSLLVLMSLFPIVMCELKWLVPLLKGIPASPANFLGNFISVALTSYVTVPATIQVFGWWILPANDASRAMTELKGTLLVIAIFVAEIAILWPLLG